MSLILNAMVQAVDKSLPKWLKQGLKRVSADRFTYRTLKRLSSSSPRTVRIQTGPLQGRQFTCSLKYERGYWVGSYESPTQRLLAALLLPGDTFFDVGAHKGYMSLIAATLVGPTGRVVAFEPNAGNFAALQQNLSLNADLASRIQPEFLAISDRCGTQLFQGANGSTVGRLVRPDAEAGDSAYEVSTTSLDAYVEQTDVYPSVLKMDIEGYEETAVRCLRQAVSRRRPPLWIEIHHAGAAAAVRSAMKSLNYTAFSLAADKAREYLGFQGREQVLCLPADRLDLLEKVEKALTD